MHPLCTATAQPCRPSSSWKEMYCHIFLEKLNLSDITLWLASAPPITYRKSSHTQAWKFSWAVFMGGSTVQVLVSIWYWWTSFSSKRKRWLPVKSMAGFLCRIGNLKPWSGSQVLDSMLKNLVPPVNESVTRAWIKNQTEHLLLKWMK